jgi:hypothetical protein
MWHEAKTRAGVPEQNGGLSTVKRCRLYFSKYEQFETGFKPAIIFYPF